MKRILTPLILALLCLNLTAQVKFTSSNKEDMKTLSEALISGAKHAFIYDTTLIHNQYRYNIRYKEKTNPDYRLDFRIQIVKDGSEYRFSSVSGKYVDLFPFWKSYINPSEDFETLATKGTTFINKDGFTFVLSKFGDNWSIQMK